jgi:ribonucleoside-diphosphate reductase alpha chain
MYIEEISVKMGKGLKTYKLEDAIEASRKYFKGDELAATVWVNKYALKDSHGNLYELTPDDMHRRLAREIARIEKRYPNPMTEDQIFELLKDFTYIIPRVVRCLALEIRFRSPRCRIVLSLVMMARRTPMVGF